MTEDTTYADLYREMAKERSQLLDRLMEARSIIIAASAALVVNKRHLDAGNPLYWTDYDQTVLDRSNEFIDAGLFGDHK